MRQLRELPAGAPPADLKPRIPVCRFSRFGVRHRVWLLGGFTVLAMHKPASENSLPCLGAGCPYCNNKARYALRVEAFAAALLRDFEDPQRWHHYTVVLTKGAVAQVVGDVRQQRGRVYDVTKVEKSPYHYRMTLTALKQVIEPPVPAFDVRADSLDRYWFEHDEHPPLELPGPVSYSPAEARPPEVRTEPLRMTPEQFADAKRRAMLKLGLDPDKPMGDAFAERDRKLAAHVNGVAVPHTPPSADPTPRPSSAEGPAGVSRPPTIPLPKPPANGRPRASMTPDPDAVAEALKRRGIRAKAAEDLTADEAVEGDRIIDFVTAKPAKNGAHKEGGAK